MDIKKDIENREDIEIFIRSFYEKVIRDENIGIIFTSCYLIHTSCYSIHITPMGDFVRLPVKLLKRPA